jgi:hypothetical protein
MVATQGASPSGRMWNEVGRDLVEPDVGLLTGLSFGEVFRAFEVARGMVFLPTEPPDAALFIALALVTAVMDCVVRWLSEGALGESWT